MSLRRAQNKCDGASAHFLTKRRHLTVSLQSSYKLFPSSLPLTPAIHLPAIHIHSIPNPLCLSLCWEVDVSCFTLLVTSLFSLPALLPFG